MVACEFTRSLRTRGIPIDQAAKFLAALFVRSKPLRVWQFHSVVNYRNLHGFGILAGPLAPGYLAFCYGMAATIWIRVRRTKVKCGAFAVSEVQFNFAIAAGLRSDCSSIFSAESITSRRFVAAAGVHLKRAIDTNFTSAVPPG